MGVFFEVSDNGIGDGKSGEFFLFKKDDVLGQGYGELGCGCLCLIFEMINLIYGLRM